MNKTVITTNLIITNDIGQIYLAKRSEKEKYFSGFRSIPGGTVDDGEEIDLALHREIKEELNVQITDHKIFDVYDYRMNNGTIVHVIYFVGQIKGEILLDENELSEGKWFDINNELLNIKMAFNQKIVLKDFLTKK